ncbi:hypothetical protein V9T40_002060 [Parthenolecanium corni]|uniref:Uncharacterized protein n=1 Tax=Parthenolecanium corni TaxID=536013 RepID=A0AAN9Y425_9HEMI
MILQNSFTKRWKILFHSADYSIVSDCIMNTSLEVLAAGLIFRSTLREGKLRSLKAEIPDEDTWDESPKIKEVAEGPYYDQFDYNVTRNYTVIAGTPAELLCRVKLKATDGNKTQLDRRFLIRFTEQGLKVKIKEAEFQPESRVY